MDNGNVDMRALALLALSFAGGYSRLQEQYPTLASFLADGKGDDSQEHDLSVAISLQRWPPDKIEMKERSTSRHENMEMGYSVAALQEMQLLHQLHFLIPSPQGHPNFILPLAIALDSDSKIVDKEPSVGATSMTSSKAADDILAMIERNQKAAGKKQLASGSHLVLEPTPLNLQKVMSRYQRKNPDGRIIPQTVLASWCHDILSAISFCHSNHIVMRSLLPDQIHLDHSGTAKMSGLSKVMVLHGKDRTKEFDPLKYTRVKKGRDHNTEDVEPFAAPELLLGGTRHTKETDMWAFGALMANLLLGKQLFPGKDRVSKMTQVFKIVGVPGKDNYDDAKKFPFHSNNMYVIGDEGKKKKYPRAVEKAVRHMLGVFGSNLDAEFSGLISLIDGLLHLDPKRRMTADEALGHQFMRNYSMQVERQDFRQKYVKDWLELKENVLTKGQSSKSSIRDRFAVGKKRAKAGTSESTNHNGGSAEKELKRKAFLIGASSGADGDDLYNLDDLLSSSKKPKFSEK
jgi:serine/threonine protein kinase